VNEKEAREILRKMEGKMLLHFETCHAEGFLAALSTNEASLKEKDAEIARLKEELSERAYPHMCRMDHDQIGFSGDNEMCPVCLAKAGYEAEADRSDKLEKELAESRNLAQMFEKISAENAESAEVWKKRADGYEKLDKVRMRHLENVIGKLNDDRKRHQGEIQSLRDENARAMFISLDLKEKYREELAQAKAALKQADVDHAMWVADQMGWGGMMNKKVSELEAALAEKDRLCAAYRGVAIQYRSRIDQLQCGGYRMRDVVAEDVDDAAKLEAANFRLNTPTSKESNP
jgi:DNA repair exonuclease SbcCD ATPase subunit